MIVSSFHKRVQFLEPESNFLTCGEWEYTPARPEDEATSRPQGGLLNPEAKIFGFAELQQLL
jgi:hypothetical protein